MNYTPKDEWPKWLQDADTRDAKVVVVDGWVTWYSGDFRGGDFRGGNFLGGDFLGGDFWGGYFLGGNFLGGDFLGGNFLGGLWHRGHWGIEAIDRLLFMASMVGIVFDENDTAVAWRSTDKDGAGRYTSSFIQPEGTYYEDDAEPAGSGTCCKGIHVTSQASALTYFGIDPTAQLWKVTFKREDLLDCDSQKARIRGGFFEKVDWPFYSPVENEEAK